MPQKSDPTESSGEPASVPQEHDDELETADEDEEFEDDDNADEENVDEDEVDEDDVTEE